MCISIHGAKPSVFHLTDELCKAALARRRDLVGKVRITTDWDLVNAAEALKTAAMLVASMQVPRKNLRAMAPLLRSIHLIGAGVEYLRPFDWVQKVSRSPTIAVFTNRKLPNTFSCAC